MCMWVLFFWGGGFFFFFFFLQDFFGCFFVCFCSNKDISNVNIAVNKNASKELLIFKTCVRMRSRVCVCVCVCVCARACVCR